MGIGFSHCEAHWSYSGFHEFRNRLAAEIGIDLERMYGFTRTCSECGQELPAEFAWTNVVDPIRPLLEHGDTDGNIGPDVAPAVAKRLRDLVADWGGDWNSRHDKVMALQLADGLDVAAAAGEPLEFC